MIDGNQIIEEYIRWIKDNSFTRQVQDGSYCAITTPFMDRHNDHIDIYVKESDGKFILSDDGDTISDLESSGTDLNTPKRKAIFESTVNGFGVQTDFESLFVETNTGNLPQKKHALLQAILAVNDMHMMSQENVLAFFKEDVAAFFKEKLANIPFVPDIKLPGKTGYDHTIDFVFPKTVSTPEKLIRTINKANKDQIQAAVFTFFDVMQLRTEQSKSIVIFNDEIGDLSPDGKKALDQYSIESFPWSRREHLVEALA